MFFLGFAVFSCCRCRLQWGYGGVQGIEDGREIQIVLGQIFFGMLIIFKVDLEGQRWILVMGSRRVKEILGGGQFWRVLFREGRNLLYFFLGMQSVEWRRCKMVFLEQTQFFFSIWYCFGFSGFSILFWYVLGGSQVVIYVWYVELLEYRKVVGVQRVLGLVQILGRVRSGFRVLFVFQWIMQRGLVLLFFFFRLGVNKVQFIV